MEIKNSNKEYHKDDKDLRISAALANGMCQINDGTAPTKSQRIAETYKATRERHGGMAVKSYEIKVLKNHLNAAAAEALKRAFLEAKWLTNYAIALGAFDVDYKVDQVQVKAGDNFETRKLRALSSQMKQGIINKTQRDIYNLSKAKKKGIKVGRLKFKKRVKTIPLQQYGNTYKVLNKRWVRVQCIGKIKVSVLNQIQGAELANAYLINDHDAYYIRITAFLPKEEPPVKKMHIGMDLGIKSQLTLSNGIQVNYGIPPTEKQKKLQRRLSRQRKVSGKYHETLTKLQKEYEHLANDRRDIINKVSSYLVNNVALVSYQDDCIRSWSRRYGRKIQNTAIAKFKEILKRNGAQKVSRFYPSTQECNECHNRMKLSLSQRTYRCVKCSLVIGRDHNSARDVDEVGYTDRIALGLKEPLMPVDDEATAAMLEYFKGIPHVAASIVDEAGGPRTLAVGSSR